MHLLTRLMAPSRLLLPLTPLVLTVSLLSQHAESRPSGGQRPVGVPTSQPARATGVHKAWDLLLKKHVHGERVDYRAFAKDRVALDRYLDALAGLDPAKLKPKARLAAYINLYNAAMIAAVLDHQAELPAWTPAHNEWGVFNEKRVRLGGKTISLNALENEVIRKQFREPRIHVALVCGAVSCPPLIPEAYIAADLDKVLERQMQRFVTDASRNTVDHQGRRIELSSIFKWYGDDFGGEAKVPAYVGKQLKRDLTGYGVSYRDYDWSLNAYRKAAAPAGGRGK